MITVALISEEQFEALRGVTYAADSKCYPERDGLGRPFISIQEMEGLGLDLQVVEWIAPDSDELNNVSNGINP